MARCHRIGGDDAEHLPLEPAQQPQLRDDILNDIGETVLREKDERGRVRYDQSVPSVMGRLLVCPQPPP